MDICDIRYDTVCETDTNNSIGGGSLSFDQNEDMPQYDVEHEVNDQIYQDSKTSGGGEPPLTLLRKGKIIPSKSATAIEKKQISSMVAIDYIINFIDPMIPADSQSMPTKAPRSAGDKILLIKAGTASGKSTVIPPYMYKKFIMSGRLKKNICVIQPRVINAKDISTGLPEFNSFLTFGTNVGYKTGQSKETNTEHGLIYINIDTFIRELYGSTDEQLMKKYMCIIIDEIHVRGVALDTTLMYIKKFLATNWESPQCPLVILMSATYDENIYMKYFGISSKNYIVVEGMSFPIECNYAKYTPDDYIRYAGNCIVDIHTKNRYDMLPTMKDGKLVEPSRMRDIIVFVNGANDSKMIAKMINNYNRELYAQYSVRTENEKKSKKKKGGTGSASSTGSDPIMGLRNAYEHEEDGREETKYEETRHEEDEQRSKREYVAIERTEQNHAVEQPGEAEAKPIEITETGDDTQSSEIDANNGVKNMIIDGDTQPLYMVPVVLSSANYNAGDAEYRNLYSKVEYISTPIVEGDDDNVIGTILPSRRVIISTNVAETGVTIDTLKYCIDTGWVKDKEFNPEVRCDILMDRNISNGAALQRKGRVGRKAPGVWYTCYTQDVFNKFEKDTLPKILTDDIAESLLDMIISYTGVEFIEAKDLHGSQIIFQKHTYSDMSKYQLHIPTDMNMEALEFVTPPPARSLIYATEKLYTLGFIDSDCNPTIFGLLSKSMMKLNIECKRMILAGYTYGANILDLITIACFITVGKQSIMSRKYQRRNIFGTDKKAGYYYKKFISDDFIDCVLLWGEFMSILKKPSNILDRVKAWCVSNAVNHRGIIAVSELRDDVILSMLDSGLNPYYNGLGLSRSEYMLEKIFDNLADGITEVKKIKKCIMSGFRLNTAVWVHKLKSYSLMYRARQVKVVSDIVKYTPLHEEFENTTYSTIPRYIILSSVVISTDPVKEDGIYTIIGTGFISVMDGFVNIDIEFCNN